MNREAGWSPTIACCLLLALTWFCYVSIDFAFKNHRRSEAHPASSNEQSSKVYIPKSIDFGSLEPGQSKFERVCLRNNSNQQLVVERIDSSCPCIRVEPRAVSLGNHQSTILQVIFDASEDPDFHGPLAIDVVGSGIGGRLLFRTEVNLVIADSPASRSTSLQDGSVIP